MNNYNDEEFENVIRKTFKKKVEKPLKFEYKIRNFSYKENKKVNKKIIVKFVTIMACLTIATTTSLATTFFVKNKVWKKPYIVTKESKIEDENKVKRPVTEEETENFISQNQALEYANLIIEKIGYENVKFENIELIRDYDNGIHYKIYNENQDNELEILMNLNPYNCKLEYFCNYNSVSEKRDFDELSENEIREIAIKCYKDLEIYCEDDEIIEVKKQPIVFGNIENDMWQVTFEEKIDGIGIPDSKYSICFNIENNKPLIYIIKSKETKNRDIGTTVITEDEAIKIATEKEKSFSNLSIDEINVELAIKKMNMFIYCLENNIDLRENNNLKIDDNSRKVWVVEIKHNKDFVIRDYDLKTIKEFYNKKYYIDSETGEIIGGEEAECFNRN